MTATTPASYSSAQGLSLTTEFPVGDQLGYHMVSTWFVQGTMNEVAEVLRRPEEYSRWWPSVFLSTRLIARGDEREVGTRVEAVTKGWLPYTISFTFEVTRYDRPHGVEIRARGDFDGIGRIHGLETNGGVEMTLDWRCEVQRPLLRLAGRCAHRLCVSNHYWTMRQGRRSLQLEIDRRRGEVGVAARPRGPVFPHDRVTRRLLGLLSG